MTSVYQGDELQGEVDELQLPHRSVCPRNTLLHTFAQGNIFEGDGLVPLPGDGDRSRSVFFVLPIDVERVQAKHTHTPKITLLERIPFLTGCTPKASFLGKRFYEAS